MNKFKSAVWLIFLIVVVVELLSQIFFWPLIHNIFKPLLMPLLMLGFYLKVEKKTRYVYVFLLSLTFSWAGDVLLLFTEINPAFFMLGLLSFFFAHICYIIVFIKSSVQFKPQLFTYATGLTLVIYGILLILFIWPGLAALKLPVILYMLVILAMGLSALFRRSPGSNLVLVGSFLFITSDSLLAINKFQQSFSGAGFWIMLSYILAQYFIVTGIIRSYAK